MKAIGRDKRQRGENGWLTTHNQSCRNGELDSYLCLLTGDVGLLAPQEDATSGLKVPFVSHALIQFLPASMADELDEKMKRLDAQLPGHSEP